MVGASSKESNKDEKMMPQEQTDDVQQFTTTTTIDDIDGFYALQLRYRFSSHQFLGLIWKSLQKGGWVYVTSCSKYQAPNGEKKGGSIRIPPLASSEVLKLLDLPAIPSLYGDLQPCLEDTLLSDDSSTEDNTKTTKNSKEGYQRKLLLAAQKLRYDAIYQMQLLIERSRRIRGVVTKDVSDKVVNNTSTSSLPKSRRNSIQSTTTREPRITRSSYSSFTSMEKGSEMYMKKNSSQKKTTLNESESSNDTIVIQEGSDTMSNNLNENICDEISNQFAEWRLLLSTNHSILLYGAGSKYKVLEKFATEELNQVGYTLLLNGYDPEITIDGILTLLVQLFLNGMEPNHTQQQHFDVNKAHPQQLNACLFNPYRVLHPTVLRAISIARAISKTASSISMIPIFLVVHNIEGLYNRIAQDSLAAVSFYSASNDVNAIRLIASVDHVDASAVLWDYETLYHFQWIWKEVHTYQAHSSDEIVGLLSMDDSDNNNTKKKNDKKSEKQKKDLLYEQSDRFIDVLASLPARATEVAQILAELQLEQYEQTIDFDNQQQQSKQVVMNRSKGRTPVVADDLIWVDFKKFRSECKSKFATNSDEDLRKLMQELIDHRLLRTKWEGSKELTTLPFEISKLQDIMSLKQ